MAKLHYPLHDMHCHLSFMTNATEVAAHAQEAGTLLFANTVTPDEWRAGREAFASFDNVTLGFGMHPWWVQDSTDIEALEALLAQENPAIIGEIGLDYGKRHLTTRQAQYDVFRHIAAWAAQQGNKLISLHSVHATTEVLDTLESLGALESCTCLFHWFTGPSDQLKRAIGAGCYFSVGPRALATGKGREYIKVIPTTQLLLETDAPPTQGQPYSYEELRAELQHAAETIAAVKGPGAIELMAATSATLLQA